MSDSPLTEWALQQIKAHGAEPYLGGAICLALIGFAGGWFVSVLKSKIEMEKLRQEARKASGENLKQLTDARERVKSERHFLDLNFQSMRDILATADDIDGEAKLRKCRDDMCSAYQNSYLPALIAYLEMIPCLVDKKEARIRAAVEVIPDLGSNCVFLELVNNEGLLKKIPEAKPYKLDRPRRDGFLLRVKTLIPFWCVRQRWKVRTIRKRTDPHLRIS